MEVLNNFEQEYIIRMNQVLEHYMYKIKRQDLMIWRMGEYIVNKDVLAKYLNIGCGWLGYYIQERTRRTTTDNIFKDFEEWIGNYMIPSDYYPGETILLDLKEHFWYNTLSQYQEGCVCYMTRKEQLESVKLLISGREKTVVLLSEFEISDEMDLPDSVVVIEMEFTGEGRYTNVFLECNFPLIFHYFNLFDLLIEILRPEEIVVMEEKSFQGEILREICRVNKIPFKI